MIAWMAYWLALSAGLGIAALAIERALHLYGRSTRAVWTALLALVAVTPVALWLWPRPAGGPETVASLPAPDVGAVTLVGPGAGVDAFQAAGVPLDGLLLMLWAVASAAVLAFLALSALRLARSRRSWPRTSIDGREVHVAPATGPAVVGMIRPAIVLPAWIAEGDADARRLVLDHEEEHLRAGDGRLLLIALLGVVLVPWNPVAWWGLRRLRLAVEVDCDARVLARGHHPRRYAELLLQVGRQSGAMPLAVAIAKPRSQLERRIAMFTRSIPGNRFARAAALGISAVAISIAACELPSPAIPERPSLEPDASATLDTEAPVVHPRTGTDLSEGPAFTPYNVSPELRNREEFRRALSERYPAELRDADIGGTVLLHVLIDDKGTVRETRVMQGSGQETLDEAAQEVMSVARFSPALLDEAPVPVWVQLPVSFRSVDDRTSQSVESSRPAAAQTTRSPLFIVDGRRTDGRPSPLERYEVVEVIRGQEAVDRFGEDARDGVVVVRTRDDMPALSEDREEASAPTFTPFTQAPELRNREEFQQALRNRYPDDMRDAGIGGTILLHVFIDTEGRVAETRVAEGSGHAQLDEAAEEVMREARFAPARNRDEIVPVWIQLPVSFRAPAPGS
jgi:TonB family protein